jgi:hypothetical protein
MVVMWTLAGTNSKTLILLDLDFLKVLEWETSFN